MKDKVNIVGIGVAIGIAAVALGIAGLGAQVEGPALSAPEAQTTTPTTGSPTQLGGVQQQEQQMQQQEQMMQQQEQQMQQQEQMMQQQEQQMQQQEQQMQQQQPQMQQEEQMMGAAESVTVSIVQGSSTQGCETNNECYKPYNAKVASGGTVTWANDDSAAHTATSGTPENGPDGTFDSGLLNAGAEYSFTFQNKGTYDYFCIVHPWMQGKVTVG